MLGGGALPNTLPFNTIVLRELDLLFATTGSTVYVSHDPGSSWETATSGLPTLPVGTELTVVRQPKVRDVCTRRPMAVFFGGRCCRESQLRMFKGWLARVGAAGAVR